MKKISAKSTKADNGVHRPITLRIPAKTHAKLRLRKETTGQSIQSIVLDKLKAPEPKPDLPADIKFWISVKASTRKLPEHTVIERILHWAMRHEETNDVEIH